MTADQERLKQSRQDVFDWIKIAQGQAEEVERLKKALIEIHDLTYGEQTVPARIREKIQKVIIVDANIDPNRREN